MCPYENDKIKRRDIIKPVLVQSLTTSLVIIRKIHVITKVIIIGDNASKNGDSIKLCE